MNIVLVDGEKDGILENYATIYRNREKFTFRV